MGAAMVAQAPLRALAVVSVLATAAHAETKYTLADLESLIATKSYKEAFVHLADIAPSQRTGRWLDVASAAATGVLGTVSAEDGATLAVIVDIDREYPQLLGSASYLKTRATLGLAGLAGCYRTLNDFEPCMQMGAKLVEGDRKLAIDAAGVTARWNAIEASTLFARDAKLACKHEALPRAVVGALGYRDADAAKTLMTTCWDAVKDEVVKAFDQAGKKSAFHANTCPTLAAKRLLSPLQTKRCRS